MPFETTPFILRRSIRNSPGNTLPTGTNGTMSPTSKFQAPQTTSTVSRVAHVDDHAADAVGACDGRYLENLGHHDVAEPLPHPLDALDDEAEGVELRGQLGDRRPIRRLRRQGASATAAS